MKIAFLLYPTDKLRVDEDSSFWIMHELIRRGHQVYHFESRDLFCVNGQAQAIVKRTKVDPRLGFLHTKPIPTPVKLHDFQAIFIRKEPPFNSDYLYTLQILELLKENVFVLNDPSGIAMANEKLFICQFPGVIPETLVSEDPSRVRAFIKDVGGKAVIKPLDNKGGIGIVSVQYSDPSLPSLIDIMTQGSVKKVMVQRFLMAPKLSDKRILLLNGEVLGVFARKPSRSDFRSNLGLGGTMHRASIGRQDQKIVDALYPELLRRGLYFVGVDVMDRYLTEINVTSPSGIPELNTLYKIKAQEKVADFIEEKLGSRRAR